MTAARLSIFPLPGAILFPGLQLPLHIFEPRYRALVSDALVNVEQTSGTEAELRARLAAARNALELSAIRYESGYSPYLEVLDAQRTANEAELAFVRNRQARLAFSVDLMKALGGGWENTQKW